MAVNDRIWTSLSQHGGGTINERVYNYLGSLGLTGTISDRLSKYTHDNKHGWQALIEGFGLSGSAGVLRQELFGDGQEGVMYVPQPTYLGQQVLYQDAAGTTPVTADGDPVGLMLDLSRGLVLGPELVDNGGFDTTIAGWTSYEDRAQGVVQDGAVTITTPGATSGLYQDVPLISQDPWVEVSIRARKAGGSSTTRFIVAHNTDFSASGGFSESVTSSEYQVYRGLVKAEAGATAVRVYLQVFEGDGALQVDSVSVRELPGNHATAPSDAARPLYRTDGVLHWLVPDGVDDLFTFSSIDLSSGFIGVSWRSALTSSGTRAILSEGAGGYLRNAGPKTNLQGGGVSEGLDTLSPQSIGLRGEGGVARLDDHAGNSELLTVGLSGFSSTDTLFAFDTGGTVPWEGEFSGMVLTAPDPGSSVRTKVIDYLAGLAGA